MMRWRTAARFVCSPFSISGVAKGRSRDLSTTQRYMHLSPSAMDRAVALLAGKPQLVATNVWRNCGDGAGPAHARVQVVGAAEAPPDIAAVLRTLIRMNHCAARASPPHGHQHRVEHEFAVNGRFCRPADDLAGTGHDAGLGRASPATSECKCELPLQEVRDQDGGLADRPAAGAIAVQGAQLTLAHQARDAVLTTGLAGLA